MYLEQSKVTGAIVMDTNESSSVEFGHLGGLREGRAARLRLLQLVAEGEISAEEAAERLSGGSPGDPPVPPEPFEPRPTDVDPSADPGESGKPRWFRVRVTDTVTGRSKATVSIPLGIVDWGLRVGAHFSPDIKGLPLDELGNLLRSGQEGLLVDVMDEEDGEHVEIFVE
jgi:hypothetical protein